MMMYDLNHAYISLANNQCKDFLLESRKIWMKLYAHGFLVLFFLLEIFLF